MLKRINIFMALCLLVAVFGSATTASAQTLTLPEFWSEYFWNSRAAKLKYEGKVITIEGVAHIVSTGKQDMPRISIATTSHNVSTDFLWCSFTKDQLNAVAGVRQGQPVKIKGYCVFDRQGNVYLNRCTLVK